MQRNMEDLFHRLNQQGYFFTSQLIKEWLDGTPRWKDLSDLGLESLWSRKWHDYTNKLTSLGWCRLAEGDRLHWEGKEFKGGLHARELYLVLIKEKVTRPSDGWFLAFWKTKVQIKMIIFLWLVWRDRNLTWSNLLKRGWEGPGMCTLCSKDEEDNNHLFYLCPFASETLDIICKKLKISTPVYQTTEACLHWWLNRGDAVRAIPILFHWNVWIARNIKLFNGVICKPSTTAFQILSSWELLKIQQKSPVDLSKRFLPHEVAYPLGYFDGASQNNICGCGAVLFLSPEILYKIHWHGGEGTNTRAEVLALWGLIWFARQLCLDEIRITGDSKVVIDHMNQKADINVGSLFHWLKRIKTLRDYFNEISFHHIYREMNEAADQLSKQGLDGSFGKIHYQLFLKDGPDVYGSVSIG